MLTLSLFVPRLPSDNTDLSSDINVLKMVGGEIVFIVMFFKEYLISFLMVRRLIDFVLVVLDILMFKVCGITGISKIEFFIFFGTERVNENIHNVPN